MFKIDSITNLGTQPIPGLNRAGQECYEFSQYTLIRNEVQKLSRVGQSSDVHWLSIIDNSIELLTYYTKDIQIASYLAYGLFHQYQFRGLAAGLNFLLDFIVHFWEEAYPQGRLKAKIEALNWYATQSLNHLKQIKLVSEDEDFLQPSISTLKNLERELLTRNVNIDLFSNLQKKIESTEVIALPTAAQEQTIIEMQSSNRQNESSVSLEPAFLLCTQFARELMEKDRSNPYAYYLNRVASWSGITGIPFNDDGLTLVKPPEYFNQERIKKVQDTGNWAEIVATAEEMLPQEPFWLDLNLISLNALQKLDGKFNPAYETTKRELVHFINRIPGIEKLRFSDKTPFLSEHYVAQLNLFTVKKSSQSTDSEKTLSAIEQNQLQAIKEVIAHLNTQKADMSRQQIELLHKDSISNKVKLLSYMAMCESLLDANEQSILKPYLTFILELINKHHLIAWEPGLALDALILTYRCMKFLKNSFSTQEMDHVFSLITKLDLNAARELAEL
ncbi:ImpA domain-containing protein [Legionella qingyii]|uniref:ImpA domain-containing protein n=1 Tax=Legionella qingyii TaxID=2184757 RepID=A0A317U779_9GAMM|nr:TssA family type VI secretion system protein [Legionella qingyii]PWY56726.1 ImpA domain-containing protein [Legionella qingyii]RUR23718.1 ImpA domain-containing protein [Legionella qingyii]RUR26301.1 ImpA domain-containing protein [Legionella qingyii]